MKILAIGDFQGNLSKKLISRISHEDFDFVIGVGDYAGIDEWYPYIKYMFSLKKSNLENKKLRKSPQEFFGKEKFKRLVKKDFEAGKKVLSFLNNLKKPGFFVFGNGDDEWYNYPFSKKILQAKKRNLNFLKKIRNIKDITYGVKNYGEISFLGFGGYMDATANNRVRTKKWQRAVDKRNNKAKKKMDYLIKQVRRKSIFILHYPPKGIFDKIIDKKNPFHGGSTGIDFFRKAIIRKRPILVLCGHMHEYQGVRRLNGIPVINPGDGEKNKFAIVDIDEKKGKVGKIKFIR
jgi:Icc-related predicted phosphoesterase